MGKSQRVDAWQHPLIRGGSGTFANFMSGATECGIRAVH